MTTTEIIDKLRELYRAEYRIQKQIDELKQQLINSLTIQQ